MAVNTTTSLTNSLEDDNETQIQQQEQTQQLDENAPRPRLCHLRKWPDFQGYGFNLHAERSKLTQHIGKVDANSPAESAGLREGDRIIEVNFVNISNENHQQVVKRIRNGLELNGQTFQDQVVLLVLDPVADEYYKKKNIVVKNTFSNVLRQETAERSITSNQQAAVHSNSHSHQDDSNSNNNNNHEHNVSIDSNNNNTQQNKLETRLSTGEIDNSRFKKVEDFIKDNDSIHSTHSSRSSNHSNQSNSSFNNNNINNNHKNSDINNNDSNKYVNRSVNEVKEEIKHQQQEPPQTQFKQNNNHQENKISSQSTSSLNNSQVSSSLNQSKLSNNSNQSGQSSPVNSQNATLNKSSNSTTATTNNNNSNNSNNYPKDEIFKMSAAEFKNYLKSKGRNDPRVNSVDMKKKHEIFQSM